MSTNFTAIVTVIVTLRGRRDSRGQGLTPDQVEICTTPPASLKRFYRTSEVAPEHPASAPTTAQRIRNPVSIPHGPAIPHRRRLPVGSGASNTL